MNQELFWCLTVDKTMNKMGKVSTLYLEIDNKPTNKYTMSDNKVENKTEAGYRE